MNRIPGRSENFPTMQKDIQPDRTSASCRSSSISSELILTSWCDIPQPICLQVDSLSTLKKPALHCLSYMDTLNAYPAGFRLAVIDRMVNQMEDPRDAIVFLEDYLPSLTSKFQQRNPLYVSALRYMLIKKLWDVEDSGHHEGWEQLTLLLEDSSICPSVEAWTLVQLLLVDYSKTQSCEKSEFQRVITFLEHCASDADLVSLDPKDIRRKFLFEAHLYLGHLTSLTAEPCLNLTDFDSISCWFSKAFELATDVVEELQVQEKVACVAWKLNQLKEEDDTVKTLLQKERANSLDKIQVFVDKIKMSNGEFRHMAVTERRRAIWNIFRIFSYQVIHPSSQLMKSCEVKKKVKRRAILLLKGVVELAALWFQKRDPLIAALNVQIAFLCASHSQKDPKAFLEYIHTASAILSVLDMEVKQSEGKMPLKSINVLLVHCEAWTELGYFCEWLELKEYLEYAMFCYQQVLDLLNSHDTHFWRKSTLLSNIIAKISAEMHKGICVIFAYKGNLAEAQDQLKAAIIILERTGQHCDSFNRAMLEELHSMLEAITTKGKKGIDKGLGLSVLGLNMES